MAATPYTADEMMIVSAARCLRDDDVCFVGIGVPSAACNLARLTHAPGLTLIYESGTIGARPSVLPLSIGDSELCTSAMTTVSVPEMFRYWLQGGRISIGFLSAAQMDRYGNLNSTVIGPYEEPVVRLPGGGGAPEIATSCREVLIIMRHTRRTLVESVDFITSLGFGPTGAERSALGIPTRGPSRVLTDLCVLEPEAGTHELVVTSIHPGVEVQSLRERTGWELRLAGEVGETPAPTAAELEALRGLLRRTDESHRASAGKAPPTTGEVP